MYADTPPPPATVQKVVAERVPRDAPQLGLRAGELIVSFRVDHRPATRGGQPDARVTVSGLGAPRGAERAPFSTHGGRCLDAHAARPLRSWRKGRTVSVRIRTGDGHGHYRVATQRVRVVPFNLGDSEQAYATTALNCFSVVR
ncbi:MAG: hypothetical protein PGN13_00935 [Patulibacter minatonensis]